MGFYCLWFLVVAGGWWLSFSPNANCGVALVVAGCAVLPAIYIEKLLNDRLGDKT